MTKIMYLSPIGTDAIDEHIMKSYDGETKPGYEIEVVSFEPIDGNWRSVSLQHDNCVRATIEAEKKGYDAVIMGCAADPGLTQLREAVNIPVVAPALAAMHVASLYGKNKCFDNHA